MSGNRILGTLLILFLWSQDLAAQTSREEVPRRIRRKSPIESTIFRGDWWDYYNRGIRKFDNADLRGAEQDLREAIKLNPDESPRARTYGVRFQEYFPRAELGAVLYEMGRYSEAIPELQLSLQTQDFDQTRFYLHEARRQVALQSGLDKRYPEVQILEPFPGLETAQKKIQIMGIAQDDIYVDRVMVSDKPVLTKRASSKVEFKTEILLKDGLNEIPIATTDLTGKETRQLVSIFLDNQGPVFCLDNIKTIAPLNYEIVGKAYDSHLIANFSVNGNPLSLSGQMSENIVFQIEVEPDESIDIQLLDGLGNPTNLKINPKMRVGFLPDTFSRVRLVDLKPVENSIIVSNISGPQIEVLNPIPNRKYIQDIFFVAKVKDPKGIQKIFLNNDLVNDIPRGVTEVYFSKMVLNLTPGKNTIKLSAINMDGIESVIEIPIIYQDPLSDPIYRLNVLFDDYSIEGLDDIHFLSDKIINRYRTQMGIVNRFNLFDNNDREQVLRERRIALSSIIDNRFQSPIQTLSATDLILKIRFWYDPKTVTMYLSWINTITGNIDLVIDRRFDIKTIIENIGVIDDLILETLNKYPLVEGDVMDISSSRLKCSISKQDGIREGLQVLVLRFKYKDGQVDFLEDELIVGKSSFRKVLASESYLQYSFQENQDIQQTDFLMQPVVGDKVIVR